MTEKSTNFEWELIYRSVDKVTETWRAKVKGGWLVKNFDCIYTDELGKDKMGARRYAMSQSMVFVADEKHTWIIE